MLLADPKKFRARISLIPGFSITVDGKSRELGNAPSRLLAVLALSAGPLERSAVASTLWPDLPEARAGANLRNCLWRLKQLDREIVESDGGRVRLSDSVGVDYSDGRHLAHQVLGQGQIQPFLDADGESRVRIQQLIHSFTSELLVGWYEEWLDVHQERWRQLRLHALDSLSTQLTNAGLYAPAIDAATAAVAAEPLRESGYRSLVAAHLAEGNVGEAIRTHNQYCSVLERELGVSPSLQMYELLRPVTGTTSPNGYAVQSDPGRGRGPGASDQAGPVRPSTTDHGGGRAPVGTDT